MRPPALLAVLVGWGFCLCLAFWIGAGVSEREWPSLKDRTVWTPAEMRREAQSQVFAAPPAYVEPPRMTIGYYGLSTQSFYYGNAAVPGSVQCARMAYGIISSVTITNQGCP